MSSQLSKGGSAGLGEKGEKSHAGRNSDEVGVKVAKRFRKATFELDSRVGDSRVALEVQRRRDEGRRCEKICPALILGKEQLMSAWNTSYVFTLLAISWANAGTFSNTGCSWTIGQEGLWGDASSSKYSVQEHIYGRIQWIHSRFHVLSCSSAQTCPTWHNTYTQLETTVSCSLGYINT